MNENEESSMYVDLHLGARYCKPWYVRLDKIIEVEVGPGVITVEGVSKNIVPSDKAMELIKEYMKAHEFKGIQDKL